MTEKQRSAVDKLREDGQKKGATSSHARAVFDAVRDAMIGFCEQQEELADAVLQKDNTLGECCQHIMQKCGQHISDIEVYARAVEYYFPGAKIQMKMTVYMSEHDMPAAEADGAPRAKILDLKFEDLFGL